MASPGFAGGRPHGRRAGAGRLDCIVWQRAPHGQVPARRGAGSTALRPAAAARQRNPQRDAQARLLRLVGGRGSPRRCDRRSSGRWTAPGPSRAARCPVPGRRGRTPGPALAPGCPARCPGCAAGHARHHAYREIGASARRRVADGIVDRVLHHGGQVQLAHPYPRVLRSLDADVDVLGLGQRQQVFQHAAEDLLDGHGDVGDAATAWAPGSATGPAGSCRARCPAAAPPACPVPPLTFPRQRAAPPAATGRSAASATVGRIRDEAALGLMAWPTRASRRLMATAKGRTSAGRCRSSIGCRSCSARWSISGRAPRWGGTSCA